MLVHLLKKCLALRYMPWEAAPTIVLTFEEPQAIASVTFQNIQDTDAYDTVFSYETTDGSTNAVIIQPEGASQASTTSLTSQQVKPENVLKVTLPGWRTCDCSVKRSNFSQTQVVA